MTRGRVAAALIGVLVAAAVIVVVLLVTRSSPPPAAAPTATATAGASSMPSATASAPSATPTAAPSGSGATTAACSASQMSFTVGTSGAAGGAEHVLLRITSQSATACTLNGYMVVQFITGSGAQIGVSDADSAGLVASSPSPQPLTLTRGATAGFLLSWQQGPVDPAGHSCPVAATLRLTAPGAAGTGTATATTADGLQISPCGNSVEVGPVTAPPFAGY